MNKVYTIELERVAVPFAKHIPRKLQVIFTFSKPKLKNHRRNQAVTTCLFRDHLTVIGMGYAVENPNDERDEEEGRRWAYKRAVQSMLNRIAFNSKYYKKTMHKKTRKAVDKAFRVALREAKGK